MSKSDGHAIETEKGTVGLKQEVTTQQTRDEKDEELVPVTTVDSVHELPFSRARCVALVATIAAAPFLSVSEEFEL